jgi:hypothetical protein
MMSPEIDVSLQVNKNSYYRGFREKRMVQELQAITDNAIT